MMELTSNKKKGRGRPTKNPIEHASIRDGLLRSGVALLTEKGFASTGLDEILKRVSVPKGSFYYYFDSKESFGLALIDSYDAFFSKQLDSCYLDTSRTPLDRIQGFMQLAQDNMKSYDFTRGCLVGNLGQEMAVLPESFRAKLSKTFVNWQNKTEACLIDAMHLKQISSTVDCEAMAAAFWIGWEGAVLRAKLERSVKPLVIFESFYMNSLKK